MFVVGTRVFKEKLSFLLINYGIIVNYFKYKYLIYNNNKDNML